MLRKPWLFIGLLVMMTLISGCSTTIGSNNQLGNLTVHTVVPASFQSQEIELILTQGGRHSKVLTFPLQGEENIIEVDHLYAGEWSVTLNLRNNEGIITHKGSAQIEVLPDKTTIANLALEPNNGFIHVIIDLSNMVDEALVKRSRLTVEPGGYNSATREENSFIMEITREVMPRTYDYRISLYGEGSTAEHLIYASPWYQTTVEPGKESTIYWSISAGELELISEVVVLPPVPTGLEVYHVGEGIVNIFWTLDSDPLIAGYKVYVKDSLLGPFKLVEELDSNQNQWVMEHPLRPYEQILSIAISSISLEGYESMRTDPVNITLPGIPQ